jgi:hypothetical protein
MKKSLVVLAAMVMVFAMVSGAYAAAQQSNTVTVNATISGVCSFSTGTSTITFPAIDPSDTGEKTAATAGLTYKCTNGTTPASLTNLAGSHTLASTATPADTMVYTLTSSALTAGTGFAAAGTAITITAHIADTVYQVAPAHADYTGTVVLTFAY